MPHGFRKKELSFFEGEKNERGGNCITLFGLEMNAEARIIWIKMHELQSVSSRNAFFFCRILLFHQHSERKQKVILTNIVKYSYSMLISLYPNCCHFSVLLFWVKWYIFDFN